MAPTAMKAQTRNPTRAVPAMPGTDRGSRAWTAPVALAVIHLLLALAAFDPTPHTGGDNAAYVALARSILEHGRYVELWDPATPPHRLYPPGFPALLALAMLVGLKPWVGLKLLIVATSTAPSRLLPLARAAVGRQTALAIGILLATSPAVVDMSHWVLSDVPFWMLTMAALWGFARLEAGRRDGAAIGIAATVLAYFTRSAGIPLVLAVGAWLALEKRWRTLAAFAAVLLPLALLWWLRGRGVEANDYVSQFLSVNPYRPEPAASAWPTWCPECGRTTACTHSFTCPSSWSGRGWRRRPAGGGVAILAVAGWILRVRKPGLPELFLPLYIGLLYVWPEVWAGDRFLLPAVPVILGYAAHALMAAVRRLGVPRPHWAGAVSVAAIVLLALPAQLAGIRRGIACTTAYRLGATYPCLTPPWQDFFSVAEWTRVNLPEDAVLLTRKPRLFYELSGRRGRIYPRSPETTELLREAREAGARYIVLDLLDAQSYRYLLPALAGRPGAFCVVHTLGPERATVLGVVPDAESVPDREGEATEVGLAMCPADYRLPSR